MSYKTLRVLGQHKALLASVTLGGFDTGHPNVLVRYLVDGEPYGYYIPLELGHETESALALQRVLNAFGDPIDVTYDEKPLDTILNHTIGSLNCRYGTDLRDLMPVTGQLPKTRIVVINARSASGARIKRSCGVPRTPSTVRPRALSPWAT